MTDDGTITKTADGLSLLFERRLEHPVEEVWDALVDPRRRALWFFAGTLEPRIDGVVDLVDSGPGVTGRVIRAEAPQLLEMTWSSEDAPKSTVRFELTEDGGGCRLVFVHEVDRSARPGRLLPGWHCIFDDLAAVLDDTDGDDDPGRFGRHLARYAAQV